MRLLCEIVGHQEALHFSFQYFTVIFFNIVLLQKKTAS